MQGTFVLIPNEDLAAKVPAELATKFNIRTQRGDVESVKEPSWDEACAERLHTEYGVPRPLTYGGKGFTIMEMPLDGGLDKQIEGLQSKKPEKVVEYQMLTAAQARSLLAGDDIFR